MQQLITSVPKHLSTPDGATHFTSGYFDKVESQQVQRWYDNKWHKFEGTALQSVTEHITTLCPIRSYEMPEAAQRVTTPHGAGTVVAPDIGGRLLVDLDDNPFIFRPAAYFRVELKFID